MRILTLALVLQSIRLPTTTTDAFLIVAVEHHPWSNNNAARRRPRFACQSRRRKQIRVISGSISSDEVQSRLLQRIALLREKDRSSKPIAEKDLKIVFEDDDLIVIDKPAGVLCIPSEPGVPSLAEAAFDYVRKQQQQNATPAAHLDPMDQVNSMDQMVVHRLGFDTAGLIVFAKTVAAVRGMNAAFRTRKITRQYEVLVAGHVAAAAVVHHTENNNATATAATMGWINLPLMRCYEHPPYMRISTDAHQKNLVSLDVTVVSKKLLEAPKASLTHYQVISREYWNGQTNLPVTRMTLTSMTGRTHQLNVHCAAMGHPIVRDTVYGFQGSAAPCGGLDESELPQNRANVELQKALEEAAGDSNMCVHAKLIRFRHPTTGEVVEFTSTPSF